MALEVRTNKQVGNAENTIKGLPVEYNYEYEEGGKPEFLRGVAKKEGLIVQEVIFFPNTNMIQATTHDADSFDTSLINSMTKDLRTLYNSF